MIIRNVAYLSGRKVEKEFTQVLGEFSLSKVDAKLNMAVVDSGIEFGKEGERGQALHVKLERLINHLGMLAFDFEDSDVKLGSWVRFDLTFDYATGHRDSSPGAPNDLIFFASSGVSSGGHPVKLLLCGSSRHARLLRSEPLGHKDEHDRGRVGSNTDWIDDVVMQIEEDESGNRPIAPKIHSRMTEPEQRRGHYSWVAQQVHRITVQDHPPAQTADLKGLAQVLWIAPNDHIGPLVLATPLYLEYSHKKRGFLERMRRRFRGV
ncbi:SAVMC3_10250 family protein [Nocardiopsis valliformis]|uniref:SAVMC3_10250 family protein n=1 Tax=Nocardiopsis valliformis TaxID=239974 RepID=UPI0023A9FE93|nr:SAVMC3_10250 family protein [Nocardiopsis valliformis]